MPDKLSKQVSHFEDRKVGISTSNSIFFSDKKTKLAYKKHQLEGFIYYDLIQEYNISLDTVILRKKEIEKLDYSFSEKYNYICDMDLIIRLSRNCNRRHENKALSQWRYHGSSLTFKDSYKFIEEKKTLIQELDILNEFSDEKYLLARKNFLKRLSVSETVYIILNSTFSEKINYFRKNFSTISIKAKILLLISLAVPFDRYILRKFRSIYGMIL